jgi:tetratricopeptide (TPR) repeat protein
VSLNSYAVVLQSLDRDAEAEPMLRRVLEWRRRKLGDDHLQTRGVMINYCEALRKLGRPGEAEAMARQAVESARRTLGSDHPETAKCISSHAALLSAMGQHEPALTLYREAMTIYRRSMGSDHPSTLNTMSACAGVLTTLGRDADAEPLLAEVYGTAPAARLSPKRAALLIGEYGPCLVRLGRHQQAEAPLVEAQRRLRETGQSASTTMRDVLDALAQVCDHTNRADEAAKWRRQLAEVAAQRAPHPASQPTTAPA